MLSKHFDSHHSDLCIEKICLHMHYTYLKCRYSVHCKCLPRSFSSKQATPQKYNVNPVTIFIPSLDDNFVILAFLNPFCTLQKLLLSLVVYLSSDFVSSLCGVTSWSTELQLEFPSNPAESHWNLSCWSVLFSRLTSNQVGWRFLKPIFLQS